MAEKNLLGGELFLKQHKFHKRWRKVVTAMASVVVFCTTYALILPAITMEKTCPIPEHTHGDGCYEAQMVRVLDCQETVHSHKDGCRDENGDEICGYADFVIHTHGEACWDAEGNLCCTLPEIEAHTHDDSCFVLQKHVHDDSCLEAVRGELICLLEEVPAHTHDDSCSGQVQQLTCGMEETGGHAHGPECYTTESVLSCGQEESETHSHDDSCRTEVETLSCGQEEVPAHSHTVDCYTLTQLVCDLQETQGHTHGDACWDWTQELVCQIPEETWVAICGQEEKIPHIHDAWVNPENPGCYDETGTRLICGQREICTHSHTESCFREEERQVLVCTQEAHTHTPECQPASGMDYICGKEEHTHGETCYDEAGNLTCTQEEHAHTEACLAEEEPVTYVCGKEEHVHGKACFDETGKLVCPLEEHTHQEQCRLRELTEEEQARVEALIQAIDALPSNEEISQALAALEETGDQEGYDSYLAELASQALSVYVRYEDMEPSLRYAVTNAQKLMNLAWLWSAGTLEVKDKVTVYQVNSHSQAKTLLVHGGTIRSKLGTGMIFTNWNVVFVENKNGFFYVQKYEAKGKEKLDYSAPEGGFLLLLYDTTVNAEAGDQVQLDFDYTSASGYNSTGHGTVSFGIFKKADKDNREKLTTVLGADTRNLIEVNLYDYGSNINDLYNGNKKYPGFQQDNGTKSVGSSLNEYSFNFGNNITADLAAGHTSVTNQGGTINTTTDGANSPISGAMKGTLGSDGYPALADGTSLSYLFSNGTYAKKQNSQSINGLFQYNRTTGAYTFNSRTNHAQFNSGSDTFTLYKQIITSNFMMYPFGNFLPFNDIVHQSAQASTIDKAYLQSIAASAQQKYNNGLGAAYNTLATSLEQFINVMDGKYPKGWGAAECLKAYFEEAGIGINESILNTMLGNIYSIDYDEPTDFYFGMEMKMNFMQPHNGLTGLDGKQPMVFYFTGDDDVWVYIDGVLFLDLSGIHRHVGGEIDFVNGVVKYYSLDKNTGDVSTVPYKTVKFSELVSQEKLNDKGTFQDYSTHSFNFYYMERGAGSGVCRMNFNFPLLHKNSISVSKALSVDKGDAPLLGNPDFKFQALKEDGKTLFIAPDTPYKILDADGKESGTGTTDENGVFKLKAGQTALFTEIQENAGKYFIRELLDASVFEQYGQITVDGTSQTENYDVTVGKDAFKGVNSPVKNVADGSTIFHFNNQVTRNKTGSLTIKKELELYEGTKVTGPFEFWVTLDGTPLPEGTAYTVGEETRSVTKAGIIPLQKDETAVISGILAGTPYTVKETTTDGYWVTYTCNGNSQTDPVSGTIGVSQTVAIVVTNSEKGTKLEIPLEKTLVSPDGEEHTYTFRLVPVKDESGQTAVEGGQVQTAEVAITNDPATAKFQLEYPRRTLENLPATFYYRITEDMGKEMGTIYDQAVYVVEVTVTEKDTLSAAITQVWKNGEELSADSPIAFVNRLDSYELPQTGGPGTNLYIAGGAALTMAAALLLYYQRKRRRGEAASP